jgi:hypothetical protein
MVSIKKLGTALILAAVLAGGLGTASLEAAGKKKPSDPQAAICSYLWSVMTYPYVNYMILAYATSLYTEYGCSAQ